MINVDKLHGKVVENKMNWGSFSKKIGMHRTTLHRKLSTEGETFTIGEVNIIVEKLHLTKDEAMDIFFKDTVA